MNSLIHCLRENGKLSEVSEQLVLGFIEKWRVSELEALIQTHIFSEEQLADTLSQLYRLHRIMSIDECDIWIKGFDFLPYAKAKELSCLFIHEEQMDQVMLVVADPSCAELLDFVKEQGFSIELALMEFSSLHENIQKYYPIESQLPSLFQF